MAQGIVRLSDVIVPEIFTGYAQRQTAEKTNILRSGVMQNSDFLNNFLAGAGLTIHVPSFKELDPDEENISTDNGPASSPNKMGTTQEIAVRLSRNNSWSAADLVAALIAEDPMDAIAGRVSTYWSRRLQRALLAIAKGVFLNNETATDAYHVQNDMTANISGASFSAGVTSFSAEAFIDATLTMGDSMGELMAMAVHSVVYARMQKNNLIEFIPDATGAVNIPTFLGRMVIVDDMMPVTNGVFETWLFGAGAFQFGSGAPATPTEIFRNPAANNGAGEEVLHNRVEWSLHPTGYAYIGTPAPGGPSNLGTANNLASAGSWRRAEPERKQIKLARLITREFGAA